MAKSITLRIKNGEIFVEDSFKKMSQEFVEEAKKNVNLKKPKKKRK